MADQKPSVLFVCVHNAGRSQMGAGYLRHFAGNRIEVRSAGSVPAEHINPIAVEAMSEVGIDITASDRKFSQTRLCRTQMWSSPWAVATHAPSSRESATRTGNSMTQQARASKRFARSATISRPASRRLWLTYLVKIECIG